MSIIDKASLIQIPSGYKSGTLYSIKPNSTDGDFDFSRSSSGTRVNSEGLIETAQIVSTTELVTNGDFATDSDWIKGTGVTISGGKANWSNTANNIGISQNGILSFGKVYRVEFTISNYSSGSLRVRFPKITERLYANGTYVYYITAENNNLFLQGELQNGNPTFSVDNVSVKEVTQNDVPRLDYSGSCPSLLLEGQSTNLITYSESLSNTNRSGTFVDNFAISPDGTQNATKITATSADPFFYQSVTLNAATYTASLWVKGVGNSIGKEFRFAISNETHISNKYIIPSEWTRFEFTASVSAGSVTTGVEIPDPAVVGDEVLAWGWQLEESSYATSYIPSNSGSQTTRTADVCNNAGTSATFNSTEGVLFAEIAALASPSSAVFISLSDGGANNKVAFYFDSNNIKGEYVVSGATQSSFTYTPSDITSFNKIAFSYKLNQFKMFANGSQVSVTDTSGNVNPANTFSEIKFDYGNSALKFEGKTKQLITFNEALSNEELADLTGQVNTSFVQLANFYNYTIL